MSKRPPLPKEYSLSEQKLCKLFYDFYVMNEIWFRTVGISSVYNYQSDKILPSGKTRIINETFSDIVFRLKEKIIQNLEWSVRSEIRHLDQYGPSYYSMEYINRRISHFKKEIKEINKSIDNTKKNKKKIYNASEIENRIKQETQVIKEYEKEIQTLTSCISTAKTLSKLKRRQYANWTLNEIHFAFSLEGWDSAYGGAAWADGVKYLKLLKESKSIKDDIFYIDRIIDLEHNNGFILDKTCFAALRDPEYEFHIVCGENPLDAKAKLSMENLICACSKKVQRIYFANSNYLPFKRTKIFANIKKFDKANSREYRYANAA